MAGDEAASLHEIQTAEQRLEIEFPDDYRAWLISTNGVEAWFGDVYLMLYPLADVVDLTLATEGGDHLPGLVVIGSDGGGERIVFDFRSSPPPIVMINGVSTGWDEGLLQAACFGEFMAQREALHPLRWEDGPR